MDLAEYISPPHPIHRPPSFGTPFYRYAYSKVLQKPMDPRRSLKISLASGQNGNFFFSGTASRDTTLQIKSI